jgi:hypothetical protein
MATVYHTGTDVHPKVGDYIAWLISGTPRLASGWYSNDISAFRIGADGIVAQIETCAVGGMGKPASPSLARSIASPLNGIDIFLYAAPAVGGAITLKEHKVYELIYNGDGSTTSQLIATVPHSATPADLMYTYVFPRTPGINVFIYTVSVDIADVVSPSSDTSFIPICTSINWYKRGFTSLNSIASFVGGAKGTTGDNKPYWFIYGNGLPVINESTFYPEKIHVGSPLDGQGLWYFEYEPLHTTIIAYRMNTSGKITETAEVIPGVGGATLYLISSPYPDSNICSVYSNQFIQIPGATYGPAYDSIVYSNGAGTTFTGDLSKFYRIENPVAASGVVSAWIVRIDAYGAIQYISECLA